MITKFFELFKKDAMHKLAVISNVAAQSVNVIEQEFKGDPSSKNVAIDSVIELLTKHKAHTSETEASAS